MVEDNNKFDEQSLEKNQDVNAENELTQSQEISNESIDNEDVSNEDSKDDSVNVKEEEQDTPTEEEVTLESALNAGEEQEEEEEKPKEVINPKKWYSLRVISGKERKIKERIELEIQRNKWEGAITQILVPSEKVYKIRNGKKVILERNILPGYILVEALPSAFRGEMITAIANVPNVIHFLGRNHPIPMHQAEANRMLGKVDESQDVSAAMIEPFIVGETVKIIDGPFNDFVGDIKDVNEEKKKLKVIVKIFGRGTEVELNFIQVEKQS